MEATAASILTRGGGALLFTSFRTLQAFPTHTTSPSSLLLTNSRLSAFRNCVGKSTRRLFCAGPQSESAVVVMEDDSSSVPPNPEEVARKGADLLDIRVGRILRAWRHPEADSLYVEEVDVGEPETRTICSGLVKYIPLDHLEGKNVVVLANLKPRNMRGVKSNGMLMAASDALHENVELLEPPEGSTPGERIWFGSDEENSRQPDAATPNQVDAVKSIPSARDESSKILQDSIVQHVNGDPRAGWKAAINPRLANYTVGQFKHLLGVKPKPQNTVMNIPVVSYPKTLNLPKEFDARTAWSQCPTISDILDQGHCGSCWAFAAVESLSDRFCIHMNKSVALSVNDLLACCGFMCGDGCDGGWPYQAWQYFVKNGIVTSECYPYFDDVGCAHPGCEPVYPTPSCVKKCQDKNMIWEETKHYSVNAYYVASDPHSIMAEIYNNGPVEVDFTVYEDFAHYKSGVYRHITGGVSGGHAVKLIGWGTTDDGVDYWFLANQWNRDWGDNGYFKIVRGTNECGIEEDAVAGLPSTKNLIRKFASVDVDGDSAL